jgi:glycosyltransferase involved in cell wall biosynthesis
MGGKELTVTIVTPAYNRAGFLGETIESVLAQDYPRIDHLVVDDGSTDGTPELLEHYRLLHPDRFRWVRHENMGQPKSINRGFSLAKGDALLILNSDDTLLEGAISRLVAAMDDNPKAVAVFPDYRVIDENGATVVDLRTPTFSYAEMIRTQNNF